MKHLPILFTLSALSLLTLSACETSAPTTAQAVAPVPPPPGPPPADIADLVAAPAAGAETQMNARGYVPARTQGLTAFWWNASKQACARIVTGDGRYQSINTATPPDCGV